MSVSRPRLLATAVSACAVLALSFATAFAAAQTALAPNTWVALASPPEALDAPVFALAVSPDDPRLLLMGTAGGTIYRSADAGASWAVAVRGLGGGVESIAFDPFASGSVLAGARRAGVWRSADSGATWRPEAGASGETVRVFGFARSFVVAGTDSGIFVKRTGRPWEAAGLQSVSVDAIAVAAVNEPSRVIAGGDAAAQDGLPLFQSRDASETWLPVHNPAPAADIVSTLASGPLPPGQDVRPLLLGTNTGAFFSNDNGRSWSSLNLAPTDITQSAFVAGHPDRFYLASDGGGSDRGGLWFSGDSGSTFRDLKPPLPEVTALALTAQDNPTLYVAAFRPLDHAVLLWSYRDTGGAPQGPASGLPPLRPAPAVGASGPPSAAEIDPFRLSNSEVPYAALGAAALVVLLLALLRYAAGSRRRRF